MQKCVLICIKNHTYKLIHNIIKKAVFQYLIGNFISLKQRCRKVHIPATSQ